MPALISPQLAFHFLLPSLFLLQEHPHNTQNTVNTPTDTPTMATAAVKTPSYDRIQPGSHRLKTAEFPDPLTVVPHDDEVHKITAAWVDGFNKALSNVEAMGSLFREDGFWRDQLALSWDFHTFSGRDQIISFLKDCSGSSRIKSISIDDSTDFRKPNIAPIDYNGKVTGIASFLTVETDVGRGRGQLQLVQDADDTSKWKAYSLFTAMYELKGYEEKTASHRPNGVDHGGQPGRENWLDKRIANENFDNGAEPTVLIVGAGQGGLTCGARLRQLDIPTLIVERNKRVGDNWRKRYHQLVLHDPVWYDHLPYLPFPPNWPIFTPKDKLGDWFESYAKLMELNVWTDTTLVNPKWDSTDRRWTVTLVRDDPSNDTAEARILRPKHIIMATGHSGEWHMPDLFFSNFQGDDLCHSSQFAGATPNSHGKKAIVVGCCNSGHDIAQDFQECGYDTTIIQRSSTYVMSSKNVLEVSLKQLYSEGGPPTEDADLLFMSTPNALAKRINIDVTKEITRRDKDLLDGLHKAGFVTDSGPDGAGLWVKYCQRGGGYYIDVGCSQLIIDGKIKVKQGQEIEEVTEKGLLFEDGVELEADEIVFATGHENMRGTARRIFGDELGDAVKDV